jgi:hypothetical protein
MIRLFESSLGLFFVNITLLVGDTAYSLHRLRCYLLVLLTKVAYIDGCYIGKYEYLYLKFTLEEATKAQSGSTGIALLFL